MNTITSPTAPSNTVIYDTPEKRAKYMDDFMNKNATYLGMLQARWQDEREYEDFEEYKKAVAENVISEGITLISYTKKSDLTIAIQGFPYNVMVSARNRTIGWKPIAKK